MKLQANRKLAVGITSLCLIFFILGAALVYATTPSTTFTISSGVYPGAPSYTIYTDDPDSPSMYYGKNEYGVVTSNANFVSLMGSILASGKSYSFKAGATFIISDHMGVEINDMSNMSFYGNNAVWKKAKEVGSTVGQMLEVDTSSNIIFRDLILDQDSGTRLEADLADAYGNQWIARVVDRSNDISFYRVQFLNAYQVGLVGDNSRNLYVVESTFDNIGEHPVYIASVPYFEIVRSRFYNWAKIWRGYIKIVSGSNYSLVRDSYFEPNQDGAGYPNSDIRGKGAADFGNYGFVFTASTGIRTYNNYFNGSNSESLLFELSTSSNIIFDSLTAINYGGMRYTSNIAPIKLQNSHIDVGAATGVTLFDGMPNVIEGNTFINHAVIGTINFHDTLIKNNKFMRRNSVDTGVYQLQGAVSSSDRAIIDGNSFDGYTYRLINPANGAGWKIINNMFSGGVASGAIFGGTNLVVSNNVWRANTTFGAYSSSIGAGSGIVWTNNDMGGLVNSFDLTKFRVIDGNTGGLVTESSGTASITSGNTQTGNLLHLFTHSTGYAETPTATMITITPTSTLGNATEWWIGDITNTRFIIHLDQDPAATVTFSWRFKWGP